MEWIIDFITQYGLIAMFLFIALEYACLPLPSEVVLPLSGAMAVSSGRPLVLVIIISVVAGLLGSMICYSIGYRVEMQFSIKSWIIILSREKGLNLLDAFIDNMRRFQLELAVSFRYFARIFRLWQALRNKT